ncbi:MAG: PQQ-binding-like beta-propeller repeat protein [Pirellulaceae bacterium]
MGLDKRTGEVVWFNGTRDLPYDTSYSGPVLTSFNGQKAMVVGCGDGAVWAFQPRTGKAIWSFNLSRRGLNAPPLVDGNTIYAGHAEENMEGTAMGALASINTGDGNITKTGKNWLIEEVAAGRTQPIKVGNHIWVFTDQAKLLVFDPETGQQVGRRVALGTMMRSSPLQADGKVYAFTVNSRWAILEPDDRAGAKIVSKGRLPSGEETHASPICVDGRIYVQTTGGLYCLKDESKESGWGETLELPQEAAVTDESPAWVQVIPADALLRPGDSQQFKVKLYNSLGQFVGDANNAEFSIAGRGSISSDGKLSLPEDMAHEAVVVTAKVGDLTGEGKVRVVPPLPWKFDFERTAINNGKGEPPVTWVGARYRHVVREEDGNKVMVKITTIPKGTRSRCWFGQSDLHDYTIQADVKGAIVDNKMPDIGLLAQGYALDLQGASQQLQIRSWVPQLRMAVTIPFPWEADTWYTMKLQASVEGGKAILKGKVWPKSESEPTDWTIEATDEVPNLSGSPGLYGNAKDAEIFLDNLSVYANP